LADHVRPTPPEARTDARRGWPRLPPNQSWRQAPGRSPVAGLDPWARSMSRFDFGTGSTLRLSCVAACQHFRDHSSAMRRRKNFSADKIRDARKTRGWSGVVHNSRAKQRTICVFCVNPCRICARFLLAVLHRNLATRTLTVRGREPSQPTGEQWPGRSARSATGLATIFSHAAASVTRKPQTAPERSRSAPWAPRARTCRRAFGVPAINGAALPRRRMNCIGKPWGRRGEGEGRDRANRRS